MGGEQAHHVNRMFHGLPFVRVESTVHDGTGNVSRRMNAACVPLSFLLVLAQAQRLAIVSTAVCLSVCLTQLCLSFNRCAASCNLNLSRNRIRWS